MTAYYKTRHVGPAGNIYTTYTAADPNDPALRNRENTYNPHPGGKRIPDPFQTEIQYYDEKEQAYRTRTVYDVSNSRVSEDMFKTPIFNNTVNNNNIDKQPIMETQHQLNTGKFNNETLNVESLVSVLRNDAYGTREVLTEFKPKFTRRYYNSSFKDITILDRSSVLQTFDSLMGSSKIKMEELLVFDTYSFGVLEEAKKIQETMINRNPIFNLSDPIYENLIAELTRSIENCSSPFNDITVTIQHRIPLSNLDIKESIYCKDVDILITKTKDFGILPHPYSDAAKRYNIVPPEVREVSGVGISYLVVDNENQVKQRWVNIGSEVMPIPVVRNPSMDSGVYYYHYNSLDDKIDLRDINLKYVTFDEAEEALGVYAYKEDAETLGNRGHINQMAIADRKEEIELMQHNSKIMEHDLQSSKARHQAELDRLKYEYDKEKTKLDRELLNQKHEYEIMHHNLTMEKSRAQAELERLRQDNAERKEKLEELQYELNKEKSALQSELERLRHDNAIRKEELEATQYELSMEKSRAQAEVERLKLDNAARKEELEAAQHRNKVLENKLAKEKALMEGTISKKKYKEERKSMKRKAAAEARKLEEELNKLKAEKELLESKTKSEIDIIERKAEKAEREVENLRHKNELERNQMMMALEMAKMNQTREAEKHYLDMEKMEMQSRALRRADFYDERSHERKDSSEFIKWVPAVLAGAGALGMWANKNRS